jgi:hypothetical protein
VQWHPEWHPLHEPGVLSGEPILEEFMQAARGKAWPSDGESNKTS